MAGGHREKFINQSITVKMRQPGLHGNLWEPWENRNWENIEESDLLEVDVREEKQQEEGGEEQPALDHL